MPASDTRPAGHAKTLPQAAELPSVEELVRVLDVASEVKRKKETLDRLWDGQTARDELRATLIDAASMTDEPLSDAQADAAVDWYYDRLHRFKAPPAGLKTKLFRAYARRSGLVLLAILLLLVGLAAWGLTHWKGQTGRQRASVEAIIDDIDETMNGPDERVDLDAWRRDAARYAEENNGPALERLERQAAAVRDQIRGAFTVRVVGVGPVYDPTIARPFMDLSVILEAVDGDGRPHEVEFSDAVSGLGFSQSRWGLEVTRPVYERVLAELRGGKDSLLFAEKAAGDFDWDIRLLDENGAPVRIMRQLAEPEERTL